VVNDRHLCHSVVGFLLVLRSGKEVACFLEKRLLFLLDLRHFTAQVVSFNKCSTSHLTGDFGRLLGLDGGTNRNIRRLCRFDSCFTGTFGSHFRFDGGRLCPDCGFLDGLLILYRLYCGGCSTSGGRYDFGILDSH
jgi:hypothetical protein